MMAAGLAGAFPPAAEALLLKYKSAGFKAYFVGGCVRDALLGITPADFDIAVSATPKQTEQLLSDCKIIPTGIKHGTLTVIYKDVKAEVTTFRKEGSYTDRRHPDAVEFTDSASEDAARRDFTVNALFYNPWEGIVDFYGGKDDIKAGVLRCVGDPYRRFSEDALRLLRALRFAARFGFEIEQNTAKAMEYCAPLVADLAAERVLAELKLLFTTECQAYIDRFPTVISAALGCNGKTAAIASYPLEYRLPIFIAEYCGSIQSALECIKGLKPDGVTFQAVKAAAEAVYGGGIGDRALLARAARRYGAENARMMCTLCQNKGLPLVNGWSEYIDLLQTGAAPLQLRDLSVRGTMLGVDGADIGKLLEKLYDYAHNSMTNDTASLLMAAETIKKQTEKEKEQ